MSSESSQLGVGSRLTGSPSQLMEQVAFGSELRSYADLWKWLSIADIAHVRALIKADVLPEPVGTELLEGLYRMHSEEPPSLDASIGDLYNNRDRFLKQKLGDLADWTHTGRARREATTVAWHIETRSAIEQAIAGLRVLIHSLVDVSDAHQSALMTDFTYLQHAHPTTLAHYLIGFAYPLSRDIERLQDAFSEVNRSPAGSGSVNGSRFDLDREDLAQDLEFDGLIVHNRDAMWAPDIAIAPVSAAMSAFVTIDRLAEELQWWATSEMGFFRPSDGHSRTSVIMPQKRNPYGLAMIRGHARDHLGKLVSLIATNLTASGQPDNRVLAYGLVPRSLHQLAATAELLGEHVVEGEFDTARMQESAASGFTSATEICDWLTENKEIPNRQAHRLLGAAVRLAIDAGEKVIRLSHLENAARNVGLPAPEVGEAELERLQDPESIVANRKGRGSTSDVSVMISQLRSQLEAVPEPRFHDFEARYLQSIRE